MNSELGKHIRPEGWENWRNPENEKTTRYSEYNNNGAGVNNSGRVKWAHQLSKKEAANITLENVFKQCTNWIPSTNK